MNKAEKPPEEADDALRVVECTQARVTVLVDNVSDLQSTLPNSVRSQTMNLLRANGQWRAAGECICCANWGLSLLVELDTPSGALSILFDAGPDAVSFTRNVDLLAVSISEVSDVVLSHGHWDHAGGLVAAVSRASHGGATRKVRVHANEGMFLRRGLRLPSGVVIPFAEMPSQRQLEQAGGSLNLDPSPRLIADGAGVLSGRIPRTRPHEVGFPGHVRWEESTSEWIEDALLEDERWLAVKVKSRGALVFSACSHAGIGNVLADAQAAFRDTPVFAVMGGFHLAGPSGERAIEATVADLHSFQLEQIVPAHCTGWRAQMALVQAFGDRVVPSAVGQTFIF